MTKSFYFLVTIYFLFFPYINFAQAPTLGTAADFVLFSTNGAVGNTGFSHLTGNVGANIGAVTGFGNVNGVMHSGDGASAQAAANLTTAYNQLNIAVPTFFPVSPILGDGDTLIAGVYQLPGVTTLDSILYLDAKGNGNAVFIFQIPGAFSTNLSSKVRLINGAQACNVFWKVEGMVSMAAATFMSGTVIANNAAISMSTSDTLDGRALSIAGAVNVNGVLAYIPTGCGSPALTGPAAPDLASISCYAIFSGNGAVTNVGISNITGDVGTNVTLTVGFLPLFVTGTVHTIPDISTSIAAADLLKVYNYLDTLPSDIELLYPAQFGNNLVLTPHTYLLNAATTLTDTLYLNAAGNPNAVFVLLINGALTTSTFSNIVLMNGTKASNVFWKVEGAVSISDSSVFNGTLISNNGAIDLTVGDSINGRFLTTSGAISTVSIVNKIPFGTCSMVLPVDWLYFKGQTIQQNVLLKWGTTNEISNAFFTIEKSTDGKTFEQLTTVATKAADGIQSVDYSFTDRQPYQSGYYRISQTDNNGNKEYYNTIKVDLNELQTLKVVQYVTGDHMYVQVAGAISGNATLNLLSIDGREISSQKIILTKEQSIYQIEKHLYNGMYTIYIESAGQKLYAGKGVIIK